MDLAADLRDLQIVDVNGEACGIVDDLAFEGKPGKKARLAAILVGPGTYGGRLPRWLAWLAGRIAGEKTVRVPWKEVERIDSVVRLKHGAGALGLGWAERRAERLLKRIGAPDALL
jgi:sporulation protein YlmC with PRC-barrel domain